MSITKLPPAREETAAERLLPMLYAELRRLAAARMRREPAGHTLQATALVHEAWLRLGGDAQPQWQSRAQFFAAAAEAMRRILIDQARRRRALRHGEGLARVDADAVEIACACPDDRVLALNEALQRFAAIEPEKADFVKLRYFAGFSETEAARALQISERTGRRWWDYARAWLIADMAKA